MTRILVPVTALMALACGSMGETQMNAYSNQAFSMDLMDGTVVTDSDNGNEGDYDLESGLTSQSLSWQPIDPEATLDDDFELYKRALIEILNSSPDVDAPANPPPTETVTVSSQSGRSWSIPIGPSELVATSWDCPQAGVRVTLTTTAMFSAGDLHGKSLESAACKTELVAAQERHTYRFLGAEGEWTKTGGDAQSTEYESATGTVFVTLSTQNSLIDPDLPELCQSAMTLAMDEMASADIVLDRSREEKSSRADGCTRDWSGISAVDGATVSGRFEHRTCGDAGYMLTCIVVDGSPVSDACGGLAGCPLAGPG